MRAPCSILALTVVGVALGGIARADGARPLPRASTATNGAWHNYVLPAPRTLRMELTTGAATRRDAAAYDRVARLARSLLSPSYPTRATPGRHVLRSVYVSPFAPYFGCYGASITFVTNALLH